VAARSVARAGLGDRLLRGAGRVQAGSPRLLGSEPPPAHPHALRALPRPASPSPPWICGYAQRASAPCTWAKASVPSRIYAPSAPRCCVHGRQRQGRSVARAEGPRHRRPRLRMLSKPAGCSSPDGAISSPARPRRFPQPLWTTTAAYAGACTVMAAVVCRGNNTGWPLPTLPASGGARWPARSGSRTNCRQGTPVCAAARGPVSAAADTASPLDCPRRPLGCQATFLPPVGSATCANNRCALPRPSAPRGGTAVGTGAAALRPCCWFLSPPIPL
jgi:hypothetical protein